MHHEPEASNDSPEIFHAIAPYLAGTAILVLLVIFAVLRFTNIAGSAGRVDAVTFDVVRFSNAQRAVASAFIKKDQDIAEANDLLLGLSERTRKTIADVAGPNTMVLVKQSVVQGVEVDITEEVLKRLGLPLNVPTSDGAAYALDVAPTMLVRPVPGRETGPVLRGAGSSQVLP